MSSLTSITNAVGDAALPFWLLIRSEPLPHRRRENQVQVLNGGLLTLPRESAHSSAPFKTRLTCKILLSNEQNTVCAGQNTPTTEAERPELYLRLWVTHTHTHTHTIRCALQNARGFSSFCWKFSGNVWKQGRKLVYASSRKKEKVSIWTVCDEELWPKTCLPVPVRAHAPAVYGDVNVVFWVHRNTKLKPRCLIKCARWSPERRADTTATPSFICKPPDAGLKYRK